MRVLEEAKYRNQPPERQREYVREETMRLLRKDWLHSIRVAKDWHLKPQANGTGAGRQIDINHGTNQY